MKASSGDKACTTTFQRREPHLHYEGFQQVGAAVLGVPKVHDLVQELVHQREVVPHGILLKPPPKVGIENLHQRIKELEDHGRVDVLASRRHDVDVGRPAVKSPAVSGPVSVV